MNKHIFLRWVLCAVIFAVMVLPRGMYVVTIEHSHPISNENLPQHSHLHLDDLCIHEISANHKHLNEIEVDGNFTETDLPQHQHHLHQHHCYLFCEQDVSVPAKNSTNLLLKQIGTSFVQSIDGFDAFSDILLADWKKSSVESFIKTPHSIGLYAFYQNFRI